MEQILTQEIFTLKEVADYLKISEEKVEKVVLQGKIPGRRIENEWRFLKTAIDEWLRSYNARRVLLSQAGSLSDDDALDKLRLMIYSERGRPEKEADII